MVKQHLYLLLLKRVKRLQRFAKPVKKLITDQQSADLSIQCISQG